MNRIEDDIENYVDDDGVPLRGLDDTAPTEPAPNAVAVIEQNEVVPMEVDKKDSDQQLPVSDNTPKDEPIEDFPSDEETKQLRNVADLFTLRAVVSKWKEEKKTFDNNNTLNTELNSIQDPSRISKVSADMQREVDGQQFMPLITVILNSSNQKVVLPMDSLLCCDFFRSILTMTNSNVIPLNYEVIFKNHSTLVDMMNFVSVFGSARWNDRGSIPSREYSADSVVFADHFPTPSGKAMAKIVNDHVVGKPLGYVIDLAQFAMTYLGFKSLAYILATKVAVTFVKWHDDDTDEEKEAIYNPDRIVTEGAVKPEHIYPNYTAKCAAQVPTSEQTNNNPEESTPTS